MGSVHSDAVGARAPKRDVSRLEPDPVVALQGGAGTGACPYGTLRNRAQPTNWLRFARRPQARIVGFSPMPVTAGRVVVKLFRLGQLALFSQTPRPALSPITLFPVST